MLKAILIVAGSLLTAAGVSSLSDQLAHRDPLVITCAEYARARPSTAWLRARDCDVDYLNAGYREARGAIQELFFAIRPAGAPRSEPATLVAATRDPSVLALAQHAIGEGRQPTQEQFLIMMLRIVTTLNAARQINGRVRRGVLDRIRSRRVLSGLTTPVAPDALVVDLHASPGFAGPAAQLALGSALLVAAFVLFRQPRAARAAAAPVVYAPGESVGASTVQLRGLLLLNLGPDARTEDIEYAPPLGERNDVIERVSRAIDGIEFDARGRGVLRGADHAVIISVGHDEPVSSAIAGADGLAGAAAIRRLLRETGWRAYVPLKGRFYDDGP